MRRRIIDDNKLKELLRQDMTLKEMAKELNVSHVAVHKRIKKLGLLELPESVKSLTEKERNFCLAVVSGQSRTNAVMQAYDVSSRESAKALQNTLMKNPEIKIAIDELMEYYGLTRDYRIQRLKHHVDNNTDPNVSLKALDMSFKLASDYPAQKIETRNINFELTIDPEKYRNSLSALKDKEGN